MDEWLQLLRSAPWVLGLALLLAALSEAHHLSRRTSASLARVLSQRRYQVLLDVGLALFTLGLLLTAPTLAERIAWGAFGLFFAGRLLWHWRSHLGGAQPTASDERAQSSPAVRRGADNRRRTTIWRQRLGVAEVLVVGFTAPILWFPAVHPGLTALALLLLASVWLAVALAEGLVWPHSRYDAALAILLLTATVGALVSSVPALTVPKITGLILGLATYRLVLRLARDPLSLKKCVCGMLALALAFAALGLAFGELRSKVPAVAELRSHFPLFSQSLPGTQGGRVSTNQVAGTLLVVLPVGLAMLLVAGRRRLNHWSVSKGEWLATGVVTVLLATALLLTQSRGAWVGMLAGLLCILALGWRWGRWVLLLTVATLVGWLLWARLSLSQVLTQIVPGPTGSFSWRIDVWARAINYVRDCPFTGYGLGTFRAVDTLFNGPGMIGAAGGVASSSGSVFDVGVPHAHNVFLQAAYDLGVLGLVAYLAFLFLALRMCWQIRRHGQGVPRALAIGCLSALVAYHVYGLADVVAIGAKPGVLWWALMAFIAALHRLSLREGYSKSKESSPE